jgi:hypothetical protein
MTGSVSIHWKNFFKAITTERSKVGLFLENDTMYFPGSISSTLWFVSWLPIIFLYFMDGLVSTKIDRKKLKYRSIKFVNFAFVNPWNKLKNRSINLWNKLKSRFTDNENDVEDDN